MESTWMTSESDRLGSLYTSTGTFKSVTKLGLFSNLWSDSLLRSLDIDFTLSLLSLGKLLVSLLISFASGLSILSPRTGRSPKGLLGRDVTDVNFELSLDVNDGAFLSMPGSPVTMPFPREITETELEATPVLCGSGLSILLVVFVLNKPLCSGFELLLLLVSNELLTATTCWLAVETECSLEDVISDKTLLGSDGLLACKSLLMSLLSSLAMMPAMAEVKDCSPGTELWSLSTKGSNFLFSSLSGTAGSGFDSTICVRTGVVVGTLTLCL